MQKYRTDLADLSSLTEDDKNALIKELKKTKGTSLQAIEIFDALWEKGEHGDLTRFIFEDLRKNIEPGEYPLYFSLVDHILNVDEKNAKSMGDTLLSEYINTVLSNLELFTIDFDEAASRINTLYNLYGKLNQKDPHFLPRLIKVLYSLEPNEEQQFSYEFAGAIIIADLLYSKEIESLDTKTRARLIIVADDYSEEGHLPALKTYRELIKEINNSGDEESLQLATELMHVFLRFYSEPEYHAYYKLSTLKDLIPKESELRERYLNLVKLYCEDIFYTIHSTLTKKEKQKYYELFLSLLEEKSFLEIEDVKNIIKYSILLADVLENSYQNRERKFLLTEKAYNLFNQNYKNLIKDEAFCNLYFRGLNVSLLFEEYPEEEFLLQQIDFFESKEKLSEFEKDIYNKAILFLMHILESEGNEEYLLYVDKNIKFIEDQTKDSKGIEVSYLADAYFTYSIELAEQLKYKEALEKAVRAWEIHDYLKRIGESKSPFKKFYAELEDYLDELNQDAETEGIDTSLYSLETLSNLDTDDVDFLSHWGTDYYDRAQEYEQKGFYNNALYFYERAAQCMDKLNQDNPYYTFILFKTIVKIIDLLLYSNQSEKAYQMVMESSSIDELIEIKEDYENIIALPYLAATARIFSSLHKYEEMQKVLDLIFSDDPAEELILIKEEIKAYFDAYFLRYEYEKDEAKQCEILRQIDTFLKNLKPYFFGKSLYDEEVKIKISSARIRILDLLKSYSLELEEDKKIEKTITAIIEDLLANYSIETLSDFKTEFSLFEYENKIRPTKHNLSFDIQIGIEAYSNLAMSAFLEKKYNEAEELSQKGLHLLTKFEDLLKRQNTLDFQIDFFTILDKIYTKTFKPEKRHRLHMYFEDELYLSQNVSPDYLKILYSFLYEPEIEALIEEERFNSALKYILDKLIVIRLRMENEQDSTSGSFKEVKERLQTKQREIEEKLAVLSNT